MLLMPDTGLEAVVAGSVPDGPAPRNMEILISPYSDGHGSGGLSYTC